MKKIRQEFADTMLEIGRTNKDLIVMVGDISHGILKPFAERCPGQYYNIGICEPTIINMAAGLSKVGLTPVIHTIAPFITERAYEQIKLDFGYQKLPINIISVGGAFDYSQLGCSHHCYTDVSLFGHLSNASIMLPSSAKEFNLLFKQSYQNGGINYFKITEYPHDIEFKESEIIFGKGILQKKGSDLTVAVTGSQLKNVNLVASALEERNISIEVLYFPCLKPFDNNLLKNSVAKTKKLLTVEELSAHDGLFNLCVKSSLEINDVKYKQIAINDFIYGYGTYEDLCKTAGITKDNITKEALRLIKQT